MRRLSGSASSRSVVGLPEPAAIAAPLAPPATSAASNTTRLRIPHLAVALRRQNMAVAGPPQSSANPSGACHRAAFSLDARHRRGGTGA